LNERTFSTLELHEVRELLSRYLRTPLGRERIEALAPSGDRNHIDRELNRTSECCDYFSTGGTFDLSDILDPGESLSTLEVEGASIDPHQALALARIIGAALDLRSQFSGRDARERYPQLSAITSELPDLRGVLASIRGKILPNGEIDDNASPELRRLRREIIIRRKRVYGALESIMRDSSQTAIQEDIVTVRNGRFVIPVRTDSRSQVPGVIHGLSSSGQTIFVEPLTVIDQNNELARLRELEEAEIAQILFSISELLRTHVDGIVLMVEALTEIDFVQAKARLSAEFNCVRPVMTADYRLMLREARHPLLEHNLRHSGGSIVPITIELDDANPTMVISGPNAGGKTVVVKTVGLLALMAQMGLHVPASEATLTVFEQVLADIGDQQSIAANLSTFTAHMRNIAEMAASVTPRALILIDEVGTGTDPDEGAALGVAIVDYFRRAGAMTIATTHYNQLKMWASRTEGVLNASVEFDEHTLRPTYRLIVGVAGASSGIEIARRMDVPVEIIDETNQLLDPAHRQASDYLKQIKALIDEQKALRDALEEERQATAEKFTRLDIEFARREAERQAQFEDQLARELREFTAESERLIGSIKDRAAAARLKREAEARAAELRRSAGVRLRKQAEASPAGRAGSHVPSSTPEAVTDESASLIEDAGEIHERDRVLIKGLNREGVVESIDDGSYTVMAGSLRFRARRDELGLVKPAESKSDKLSQSLPRGVSADVSVDQSFASELNVIGSTVDEATDRVDKFLDQAFMAGAESIRIVHGHGKGALRKAIAELLTGHPHVVKFQLAPANQGGAGATIVEMKK